MGSGGRSLQRTLRYIAVGVLGTAAFVGLLTLGLIQLARALLPASSAAPAASEAPSESPEPSDDVSESPSAKVADIRVCCAALHENAESVPLNQKPRLLQAAAICDGLIDNPRGRAVLPQVRSVLERGGPPVPPACR